MDPENCFGRHQSHIIYVLICLFRWVQDRLKSLPRNGSLEKHWIMGSIWLVSWVETYWSPGDNASRVFLLSFFQALPCGVHPIPGIGMQLTRGRRGTLSRSLRWPSRTTPTCTLDCTIPFLNGSIHSSWRTNPVHSKSSNFPFLRRCLSSMS